MIKGIGASEGIAIGKVFKYNKPELDIIKTPVQDIEKEILLLGLSIEKSIEELSGIRDAMEEAGDSEAADIFDAHIEILDDPGLKGAAGEKIKSDNANAAYAFSEACDKFAAAFESMDNEYFRERAADLKDIKSRVIMHIEGIKPVSLSSIKEEVIIVSKDLLPSDTAQIDKKLVKGFVTDAGGYTCHTAIMARSFGIPAVVGTKSAYENVNDGDLMVLDGFSGDVIVDPPESVKAEYRAKIEEYKTRSSALEEYRNKKTITKDGRHLEISANIGSAEEAEIAIKSGAEGIGLFRTEFLYMNRNSLPSEQEQFEAYKDVLEVMGERPVVIRTLDIGGDKKLDYLRLDDEMNPFLGNRALRFCLKHKDIFTTQLRALLRAGVYGNLHIMFPMVATIDELRDAKRMIKEIEVHLKEEGTEISETYKVGMMVEIPSSAMLADVFAKEVDFFSIGSNDLIQYTFAADRMNQDVSYLYQPCNPSLLRLISLVIEAAHKEGKWAGLCGEMAADPKAVPLLLGLGLDEFSMNASSILKVREALSNLNYEDMKKSAHKALYTESQEQVIKLINDELGIH
ncbi:MAG: phosphoenolpyruvate--protein phosphotransferase [Clostridia bacterium]|nr:phosphoenolpyruvate--protein phosphotransferase [Clostridia bacterium]